MSLRDRLASLISPKARAAINAIEFHAPTTPYFGQGISNQPDHATLLAQSLGVADYATRAIVNRIMGLNPQVKTSRVDEAGTLTDEVLDDNALKLLLDRPHPDFSRSQLLRLTGQYIVTTGEAYWLKVGNGLGIPAELHPIPPQMVSPILSGNIVEAYGIRDGKGGQRTIPKDVVIRFYFPDPENPWRSEGYLGPNATNTDALKFTTQHLRSHFQNDATPKAVFELGEGAVPFTDDATRQRFWGLWRQRFHQRSGENQGLPAMLPPLWKLVQLSIQTGADVTPLLDFYQQDQLMNFGVPKSALGQVVSGDRSSAEVNDWVMDKHAVKPIADLIQETLTLQLAPDFDARLFVEFEKFVADDKDFELRREEQDLRLKVRSPNMVLEDRGMDPVDWGEFPVGTLADTPYTGEGFSGFTPPEDEPPPMNEEDDGGGEEPPDDEAEEPRSSRRRLLDRAISEADISQIVNALSDEEMREAFTIELRNAIKAFGQAALAEVGSESVLLLSDPRVLEFLELQGARKVTMIGDTTRQAIRDALIAGNEAGEGVGQLAARIGDVFTQAKGYRSRMIARTETGAAQTFASQEAYTQAGIEYKEWLSSRDDAVRDQHQRVEAGGLDGVVIAMGANFTSPITGASGQGPRMFGVAEDDINCRCTVLPVTVERGAEEREAFRVSFWRAKDSSRREWELRMGRLMRSLFRSQEREIHAALMLANAGIAA